MKILIADDHELFLQGLELLLENFSPNLELVKATDYTEIFDIIDKQQDFDLILTDLAMPGAKWVSAIEKIYKILPNTPIIILSAVFESEIVRQTLEIGVAGYIPKTSANTIILNAIRLVLAGGAYIPNELLIKTSDPRLVELKDIDNKNEKKHLTPRQIDVITLVSRGMANKNIAYELGLSEGTVKLYVTAILKILNVNNRTGAVVEAKRLGII